MITDRSPGVRAAQAGAAEVRRRRDVPSIAPAAREEPVADRGYAGLVTRTVAFALDAAVVNGVAAVVGVMIGLGLSILHLPEQADVLIAALLAGCWVLWTVSYFAFFWSTTGQTPGSRVMRIRLVNGADDGTPTAVRAILRFGALILAAIPLFAGIVTMLWDERGRCLQDRLLRTVVIDSQERRGSVELPGI